MSLTPLEKQLRDALENTAYDRPDGGIDTVICRECAQHYRRHMSYCDVGAALAAARKKESER